MTRLPTRRCSRFAALVSLAGALGVVATIASAGDGGPNVDPFPGANTDLVVRFDIKPTSCPNPFNPNYDVMLPIENVPAAILGTDSLEANRIQTNTLLLDVPGGGGLRMNTLIPPLRTAYEDVATPVADPTGCQCTTDGPDGYVDLTMKFDSDAIAQALGSVQPGQVFQLCITGLLDDGTPFRGCDCIFIVGPVGVEPHAWGAVKSEYR